MEKINAEDLKVGDIFETGSYQLSEEEIIRFAEQYDPQYFHTNPEEAEDSFFKTHVASGWNTAGVAMRLMIESLPLHYGTVGISVQITWPKSVYPGDTIQGQVEILDIYPRKSDPKQLYLDSKITMFNQKKELVYECKVKSLAFTSDYKP